jgi:hypothetical protein
VSSTEAVSIDYGDAGVPVRADLAETQATLLEHLRRAGSWFTGEERLAIAAESRHAPACPLCRERKAALSPERPKGAHERVTGGLLAEPVIDVAHRVRTDPGRLSRAWFERTLASELEVGPYVEAVGVVALLAGLDFFCRALGVPPLPLPSPIDGASSRHTPDGMRTDIAWVPILTPEDASGPEADVYGGSPFVPNIARALSSVPDHARMLQRLTQSHYLGLADMGDPKKGRAIDRMQIELVAARVSALNECFY